MMSASIRMPMAPVEALQLAHLLRDFRELIQTADAADPAVDRLTPSPYPDDHEAAREYQESTRSDLLERRATDAAAALRSIDAFAADAESADSRDALAPVDFELPLDQVDGWMRTLTAIRLVIATRVGIVNEEEHDPADERFHVYDWLGYRLEILIEAADAVLDG